MLKIKKRILENEFLKNSLLVGGGTLIAQVIAMLIIPALTRIYTPEDFGILQTFQYISIFFITISALKFDVAILIPKDDITYSKVVALGLLSIFFFSLLTLIITYTCYYFNYFPLFFRDIQNFLWLLPLVTFVAGLHLLFSAILIRLKKFRSLGESKIFQTIGMISSQLALGLLFRNTSGLIIGDVLGRVSGLLVFYRTIISEIKKSFSLFNLSKVIKTAKEYSKFPLLTTPGAILNISGYAIPILLFGNFYGATALGFYTLVNKLFAAPSNLIGQSVSQVFSSDTSRLFQDDPKQLYDLFVSVITKLALISIIPVVIIFLFAPQIFSFVFGEEWKMSGYYFRILAPLQFFGFIAGPLTPTLNLIGKQSWQFIWELLRFITTGVFIYMAYYFSFTSSEALLAYSLSMTFFYILHLTLSLYVIKQKI